MTHANLPIHYKALTFTTTTTTTTTTNNNNNTTTTVNRYHKSDSASLGNQISSRIKTHSDSSTYNFRQSAS
ncbi:hypothetical protein E2C01_047140 [Portunus trituberculatus]|uniref:Uncharacterized protein n=1 Tax=Portunus trituberculatus TaxID=210409 RepID=A0A5B7G0C3_PORTR|nr:hypothetical protein [Portunus trituberculatus]